MPCLLCDHEKTHKHGHTSKGTQRFFCPGCKQTFTESFDTLYYRRQLTQPAGAYYDCNRTLPEVAGEELAALPRCPMGRWLALSGVPAKRLR